MNPTLLTAGLCLLGMTVLPAASLEPINDLRFGITVLQPPKIHERIESGGTGATYDWEGAPRFNLRYEVLYVQGTSRRGRGIGGFAWGAGAFYGKHDITPDSYSTAVGTFANNRGDLELSLREIGLSAVAGYASAPHSTSYGDLNWEILPILRGGYVTGQTVTPGFANRSEGGSGLLWETGIRAGMTLVDGNWLLGLRIGYDYGLSSIPIGLGSAGDSTLTVIRRGFEGGLDIGFRF